MSEMGYQVLDPQVLSSLHDGDRDFAQDVLVGLSERPKRLSSRYFYDDFGSDYFRRIMTLDEYYPTRCETEILQRYSNQLAATVGAEPLHLIDLGAGDGKKTMIIIEALQRANVDFIYVPIDISEGAMKGLVARMRERFPTLRIEGLVSEYADGVNWLGLHHQERRNLVLFLGSNIGNFNRVSAKAFLRRLWSSLVEGDYAFIGFDLKKDIEVLLAAYNDSEGVTSAFNMNLLDRMNRELGANFVVDQFRHFGTYNVFSGAMESYLVSLCVQRVYVKALQHHFDFEAWEPIHTEYSYKYLRSDIRSLADNTGFQILASFEDDAGWFQDSLWQVDKKDRQAE